MPALTTQTQPAFTPTQFQDQDQDQDQDQESRRPLYALHRHLSDAPPTTQSLASTLAHEFEEAPAAGTARHSQQHHTDREQTIPSNFGASRPSLPKRSRSDRPTSSLSTHLSSPIHSNTAPFSACFAPQPARSGAEPRSPTHKRPPASHSSHGIETSHGPPPALITRGSYSSEIVRRAQDPADYTFAQQQSPPSRLVESGIKPQHHRRTDSSSTITESNSKERLGTVTAGQASSRRSSLSRSNSRTSHATMEGQRARSPGRRYSNRHSRNNSYVKELNNEKDTSVHTGTDEEHSADISEDLFLNLAQDSPQRKVAGEGQSDVKRKRSRTARANQGQSLPVNTFSSPPVADSGRQRHSYTEVAERASPDGNDQQLHYPHVSHLSSPIVNLRSSPRDASPSTPASSITNPRTRHLTLTSQSASSGAKSSEQYHYGRRRSSASETVLTPQTRGHVYRPSNLQYTSSGGDDSPHIDTPSEVAANRSRKQSVADGSESVDSQTAPSTVWDELDDLKSRIRKLELTGRMPTTSGAAVSNVSGERPHTATTTVTTISSSPKQQRKPDTSPSEIIGGPGATTIHPLLHSALARCKPLLSPALYSALKATASDALELAAMSGSSGPQGTVYTAASIVNGAAATDRQVRRKADNMCRSLTELCIALCDGKPDAASPGLRAKPISRYESSGESPALSYARQVARGASLEPEGRSPSRALQRVEARRVSLQGVNGSSSANNSPRESRHEDSNHKAYTQTQQAEISANRTDSRPGTCLLRARSRKDSNANPIPDDVDDDDPTLRAPSRAMTEVTTGRARSGSQPRKLQRISREYTSQHPLPEGALSSPLQNMSALRRVNGGGERQYASGASSSLLRSGERERDRGGERRSSLLSEGLTHSKSVSGAGDQRSEERRQRLASLEQYAGERRGSLLGRKTRTSGVTTVE